MNCPNCGDPVIGHPNKKFCNQRCKDRYHNIRNPRGRFAHLAERIISDIHEQSAILDEHPFSSEALGQD